MKRKYRLKKYAKNDFTRLTGIFAIQVRIPNGCLVVDQLKTGGMSVQRYAYIHYFDLPRLHRSVSVTTVCDVENCVKKDHLKVVYKPTKEHIDYFKMWGESIDPKQIAHQLDVPEYLLLPHIAM